MHLLLCTLILPVGMVHSMQKLFVLGSTTELLSW
jgi:hypothetical protein